MAPYYKDKLLMEQKSMPLHAAIIENNEDAARQLILDEVNVDELTSEGWSPLHLCAQTSNPAIAKWLINAGAQVNIKNNKGVTPLHSCSWSNSIEIAKLLLDHGANVNAKDNLQWTPMMLAAWSNHDELIDLYVQQGASINARNRNGSTALHLAAYNDCPLVTTRLLYHKASVNMQNNDRMVALDIAIKRKHKNCEEILRNTRARTSAPKSATATPVRVEQQTYAGKAETSGREQQQAGVAAATKPATRGDQPAQTSQPARSTTRGDQPAQTSQPARSTKTAGQSGDKKVAEQAYYRDTFFLLDKPEHDMPYLTELTKEQAKLSSDGSRAQPIFPEQLINITLNGDKMRRKSEVVIANLLYSLDLNYVYERKLCGTVLVGINYPAFTVFCPDDSIIIWEHVSALETAEKKQQFNLLKRWYKQNGFVEGKNFFVTKDVPQGGVDSPAIWEIAEKINALVEQSADDKQSETA